MAKRVPLMKRVDPGLVWRVRELTIERAEPDECLNFEPVAIELGCDDATAEEIDIFLTEGIMTARGAI